MIGLTHYLVFSGIILSIGVYGALTKRNAIAVLMCIELVFNAVTIALISFARYTVPLSDQEQSLGILLTGQVFAIFVIAAVPNPAFDLAGAVAGAARLGWWKFFVASWGGRAIKNIGFAALGLQGSGIVEQFI